MTRRHVPPHRIAAMLAGELDAKATESVRAHLAECPRCAAAARRVEQAREGLADIARSDEPKLASDLVWARIHWSTSSDRRARLRGAERRRGRFFAAAGGLAVAAACAVALVTLRSAEPAPVALQPQPEAPLLPDVPLPVAEPLSGVVTMVHGEAWVDSKDVDFDALLGAGAIIETGAEGRVAVQFGPGSAFSVGPDSSLRVRSFDSKSVVLDIQGRVDVEVSRRSNDQMFAVIAGDRRVEVRGTAFRVDHRGGELDVACGHGHVVVWDGDNKVDLRAGQTLSVLDAIADRRPVTVPADQRAALERSLTLPKVPGWSEGPDVLRRTGRLAVDAPAARAVAVDGRRVGAGSLVLRVLPGRHRVDAAGLGEWVEVDAGRERKAVARGAVAGSRERERQLETALGGRQVMLRRCVARLDREGLLAGTSIELEIGVNRDGTQSFLNIVDTNLPTDAAHCLRDVVDAIQFPRGPRASLRETIAF